MAFSRLTGQDAVGTATSSPVTATYASTPTQNNLMLAAFTSNTATGNNSISGWTLAVDGFVGGTTNSSVSIFYKIAGAGESKTITGTSGAGTSVSRLQIYEYTGNATVSIPDGTPTSDFSGSTSVLSQDTGSITTGSSGSLLFAAWAFNGATSAWSIDSGFTVHSTNGRLISGDLITTTPGAFNPTASWTGSFRAGGVIAGFKVAGGVVTNTGNFFALF